MARFRGGKPPTREDGDIKGWSLASRRRLRQFLMHHQVPEGWTVFGADLTVPALPEGVPNPCVDRSGAESIFKNFRDRLDRIGVCSVWRMEIQPRKNTKRDDIRGVEQPHWHIVGGLPPGVTLKDVSCRWVESLGERGKVRGASKCSANVRDVSDWRGARIRYLFDHTSKAALEQIAVGWGRHWGITRRSLWVNEEPRIEKLTLREQVWFTRFLRRLVSRRVLDRRATGGIPWGSVGLERCKTGTRVLIMGGNVFLKGWDGQGLPSLENQRQLCKVLGKLGRNVWALKTAKCKRSAGQFFGVSDRAIRCARAVAAQESRT